MATKLGKVVADFRTTLATEIAVGGTGATLQSYTDDDGVALPTGTYFFTLDGDGTGKEHIVCTQTAGVLTAVYSVSRQGIQSSGCVRKHRIGASVEITDFAHIKYMNDLLDGTTTLNASTPLGYDGTASITTANQLATKAYVDGVAVAGAPNASETVKGIIELATNAEMGTHTSTGGTGARLIPPNDQLVSSSAGAADANKIPLLGVSGTLAQTFMPAPYSATAANIQITTDADSANDVVRQAYLYTVEGLNLGQGTSGEAYAVGSALYVKAADGRLYKAAGTADETTFSFVGIALDASTGIGETGKLFAKPGGIATGLSGLTPGSYYFITDTAGTIGVAPGTRYAKIGQALTATTLRVCEPKFVATNVASLTASGATVITTGFYPAHIEFIAGYSTPPNTDTPATSTGNSGNRCIYSSPAGVGTCQNGYSATAYLVQNAGTGTSHSGTVTARSQTGFTVTNTKAGAAPDASLIWTAYSE